MAFAETGITLRFEGEGINEVGIIDSIDLEKYQAVMANSSNGHRASDNGQLPQVGKEVLAVDPKYFRPTEVDLLIGDFNKAIS